VYSVVEMPFRTGNPFFIFVIFLRFAKHMKFPFLKKAVTLVVLVMLAAVAQAQIQLRLTADKSRFLRYEPISVTLQVTNLAGNTLTFGGAKSYERGSVTFRVETANGRNSAQYARMDNPAGGLKLAPGETKELRVSVNQFYDMQREANYNITAYLSHSRLPNTYVSETVHVEVLDGAPLLVKTIGMPSKNATDVIKTLKLSLLRFSDVEQDIYCLRVEDEDNVYATFRLGDYIDSEKPQMELDGPNLIHILLQLRPKVYVYYIMGFDGYNLKMRQKRFYKSSDGMTPELSRESGYLRLKHARLAVDGVDYIEPEKE